MSPSCASSSRTSAPVVTAKPRTFLWLDAVTTRSPPGSGTMHYTYSSLPYPASSTTPVGASVAGMARRFRRRGNIADLSPTGTARRACADGRLVGNVCVSVVRSGTGTRGGECACVQAAGRGRLSG
jgi:hypothetical protein